MCGTCNIKFKNRANLKKHIKSEHESNHPDDISDPEYKDNDEKVKLIKDSKAITYNCQECGRLYSIQNCENKDNLKKHIKQEPTATISSLEYDITSEHKLPSLPRSNLGVRSVTNVEIPEKEINLKKEDHKELDVEYKPHVTYDLTKEENLFSDIEHEKIYRLCEDKKFKNEQEKDSAVACIYPKPNNKRIGLFQDFEESIGNSRSTDEINMEACPAEAELYRDSNVPIQLESYSADAEFHKAPNIPIQLESYSANAEFYKAPNIPIQLESYSTNAEFYKAPNIPIQLGSYPADAELYRDSNIPIQSKSYRASNTPIQPISCPADAELYMDSNTPIQPKYCPADAELYRDPNIPIQLESYAADAEFYKAPNVPIQRGSYPAEAELYRDSNIPIQLKSYRAPNTPMQPKSCPADAELYRDPNTPIQLESYSADAEFYKAPNIPIQLENGPTRMQPEETLMTSKSIVSASSCKLTEHIVEPGQHLYLLPIINRGKRFTFTIRFQVTLKEMLYYIICGSSKYQNVCLSDNPTSYKIELQEASGTVLHPSIPRETNNYSHELFITETVDYSHNLFIKEKVDYNHDLSIKETVDYNHDLFIEETVDYSHDLHSIEEIDYSQELFIQERVGYSYNLCIPERKYSTQINSWLAATQPNPGILVQTTYGTLRQQNMPKSKFYKLILFIQHRRWIKFSQLSLHTLANSTLTSQSTQIYMTDQNLTHLISILQWPTNKIATLNKHRNKTEQPTLQWPKFFFATSPKDIRNSQYKNLVKTYTKKLSKDNKNTTISVHTQKKLQTRKNTNEEQYKDWKQIYNQIQVVRSLKSHRTARQRKVREVSRTSKPQWTDRQTNILTSRCSTRKGHKLSSRRKMQFSINLVL